MEIFYLTAPGGKITGSVNTHGICLEYSKFYNTVSRNAPVSMFGDKNWDVNNHLDDRTHRTM